MADTVANVILDVRSIYPDYAPSNTDGDAKYLRLLNIAHEWVMAELPAVVATATVSLTADTREYALSDGYVKVWNVDYKQSADSRFSLVATSEFQLDQDFPGWRGDDSGTPSRWYFKGTATGNVLGLYSAPDETTSGGYPSLEISVSQFTALTTGGNMPTNIRDIGPYVSYTCYLIAQRIDPEKAAGFLALAREQLNVLGGRMSAAQPQNPHRANSFTGTPSRVV